MSWCSSPCCCNSYIIQIPQQNHRYLGIRKRDNDSIKLHFSSSSSSSSSSIFTGYSVCGIGFNAISRKPINKIVNCTTSGTETDLPDVDCVGTGLNVDCLVSSSSSSSEQTPIETEIQDQTQQTLLYIPLEEAWEWAVLVSPFFFWGTAMVAMKEVLPKAGPFFVSAFRLIPAGFLLVGFAASRGRPFPSGPIAWLSIALFGLVDAACFQGFLAQGLERTSAGLGSVSGVSQNFSTLYRNCAYNGLSFKKMNE